MGGVSGRIKHSVLSIAKSDFSLWFKTSTTGGAEEPVDHFLKSCRAGSARHPDRHHADLRRARLPNLASALGCPQMRSQNPTRLTIEIMEKPRRGHSPGFGNCMRVVDVYLVRFATFCSAVPNPSNAKSPAGSANVLRAEAGPPLFGGTFDNDQDLPLWEPHGSLMLLRFTNSDNGDDSTRGDDNSDRGSGKGNSGLGGNSGRIG